MTVPIVFDRALYAERRARAERAGGDAFLAREAAEHLAERLAGTGRRFERALDISSRSASFPLLQHGARTWLRMAPAPAVPGVSVVGDEEALPFAQGSFDLITSVLALHAVNDLPGVLVQIRRALSPRGLFLAALFGRGTLGELRRALAFGEERTLGGASPRVAPFADVPDMGALLQRAGFAMPVADLERLTVRYRSFATLVRDLRALGETNVLAERRRSPMRRDILKAALAQYADAEGRLCATFDLLYLTGWAS